MANKRRTCPKCGRRTRKQGPLCPNPNCQAELTPLKPILETTDESEPKNELEKENNINKPSSIKEIRRFPCMIFLIIFIGVYFVLLSDIIVSKYSTSIIEVAADGTIIMGVNTENVRQDKVVWLATHKTDKNKTNKYSIVIPEGYVCLIDAEALNEKSGGVLEHFYGGKIVEATVSDGFVGICAENNYIQLLNERLDLLLSNNPNK